MKKTFFFLLLFIAYSLQLTAYSNADTVYTKDDKELKGIIVEDYADRIILSTFAGEKAVMKSDIKELYFDSEEDNLIKLGELAREKGDYIKAFVYYDKAFKMNPDSKRAKDGLVFLQGYLFKQDVARKEAAVERHNEFERLGAGGALIKSDEEKYKENIQKLKNTAGITLSQKGGVTEIENVIKNSPAHEAGIRKGDLLIAVWGRLVGYLSPEGMVETLLEKNSIETKCTIQRGVDVAPGLIGADFRMLFDGLTVTGVKNNSPAAASGLKEGDLIVGIDAHSTRYMPLKQALELMKGSKNKTVRLTFRREVIMWGKEGV